MSMPQFLSVAVISARVDSRGESPFSGDLASTVAAIIRGELHYKQIAPNIIPVALNRYRHPNLIQFALSEKSITLKKVSYPQLINPQKINIWLALDDEGAQLADERIAQDGPSPSGFYREFFPTSVIHCGFFVPNPPSDTNYQIWLNLLTERFLPWKKRIWKTFEDSS